MKPQCNQGNSKQSAPEEVNNYNIKYFLYIVKKEADVVNHHDFPPGMNLI